LNPQGTTIEEITGLSFDKFIDIMHVCMKADAPYKHFVSMAESNEISFDALVGLGLMTLNMFLLGEKHEISNSIAMEADSISTPTEITEGFEADTQTSN